MVETQFNCLNKSERTHLKTGKFSEETGYYISSLAASAQELLSAIRRYWEVENKLNWVLDVVFREDDCRSRFTSISF